MLPWEEIENIYNTKLNNTHKGARNKPARVIIGALLIKHKMNLSDVETIEAIRENPYMQYMLGLSEFTDTTVFDPSLFVTIRKRIGMDKLNDMSESLLKLQVNLQRSIKPKSIKKKWRKILEKEMKQKPRLEQGKDFIELIILEQNCLILELHGSALVIL